jgi:hypothetical protein
MHDERGSTFAMCLSIGLKHSTNGIDVRIESIELSLLTIDDSLIFDLSHGLFIGL